jgi:hypothetical protein
MEALLVKGQPTGHIPADAIGQGPGGVAVRQTLQGPEHHHRRDDVGRDRGAASGYQGLSTPVQADELISSSGR